jgi:hypothetical protein
MTCLSKPNLGLMKLIRSVEYGKLLEAYSDDKIADMLMDHVWGEMVCCDPKSVIIEEAITRLRRTGK